MPGAVSKRGILLSRPFVRLVLSAACAAGLLATTPGANGSAITPSGYSSSSQALGSGLSHLTLQGKAPSEAVHVARISRSAPFELRAVAANGAVGNGLERTSSICARVHCKVAVNGDFFGEKNHVPLGAVVSLGQLLRSPEAGKPQLMVARNGAPSAGILTLTGTLVTSDLKSLHIDGINQSFGRTSVMLYTPAFGARTAAPRGATELVLRARKPAGPIVLSRTTVVRIAGPMSRKGNASIPRDGAVLVARGAAAKRLADVVERIKSGDASADALLRVESPTGAVESIGGFPVLVHKGAPVVPNVRSNFFQGRHPRTIVGWTKTGDVLLVTVDGRQPGRSLGMSLPEAARFMIGLGAQEAMNLDGGGSTTFVAGSKVLNTPSDKAIRRGGRMVVLGDVNTRERILGYVERPVATALVVVPKAKAPVRIGDAESLSALDFSQAKASPTQTPTTLSAMPDGSEPVIVVPVRSRSSSLSVLAVALVLLAGLVATGRPRRLVALLHSR